MLNFEFRPAVAGSRMRGRIGPATLSLGRLAELGPLRPAPAHSQMSLREGIDVRLRGGIGPLRPAPAHSS